MATGASDEISDLVGDRRYCFVIMPYGSLGAFYEHLKQTVENTSGLRCIRADDIPASAQLLLLKIHQLIAQAAVVLADLTKQRANVYYELGHAVALGKKVIVICEKGTKLPQDLRGWEVIQYSQDLSGLRQFDADLRNHLDAVMKGHNRLLRAMLVAPKASPSFIVCNPRPRPEKVGTPTARTYGDYLGVVGILYALGVLLGREQAPELITSEHVDPKVPSGDHNLYLIGSPRSNKLTEWAMAELQQDCADSWSFEIDYKAQKSTLRGPRGGSLRTVTGDHSISDPKVDYGLILRGPHPRHEGRHVLVLAGTRSLGTGAACLAATLTEFIEEIRGGLPGDGLEDKTNVVWALVKGKPDPLDGHVSPKYVSIEDMGVLRRTRR